MWYDQYKNFSNSVMAAVMMVMHGYSIGLRIDLLDPLIKKITGGKGLMKNRKGFLASALVLGMVPCPGVVMVMLFSLSMNLVGLGIMLGICISLGMALSITLVVVIGMAGKNALLNVFAEQGKWKVVIEFGVEAAAGLLVAALGLLLLASRILIKNGNRNLITVLIHKVINIFRGRESIHPYREIYENTMLCACSRGNDEALILLNSEIKRRKYDHDFQKTWNDRPGGGNKKSERWKNGKGSNSRSSKNI